MPDQAPQACRPCWLSGRLSLTLAVHPGVNSASEGTRPRTVCASWRQCHRANGASHLQSKGIPVVPSGTLTSSPNSPPTSLIARDSSQTLHVSTWAPLSRQLLVTLGWGTVTSQSTWPATSLGKRFMTLTLWCGLCPTVSQSLKPGLLLPSYVTSVGQVSSFVNNRW